MVSHNSLLNTSHSTHNLGFFFDEHLTFSNQITSLFKAYYYLIRQLCCIWPAGSLTACTIVTSVVHSKLGYCNSLLRKLPRSQLSHLQQIQNSLAYADAKSAKSFHMIPILRSFYWLKITEHIEYKLLSIIYKVLSTTQPPYLHNLISVQPPRSTRCLSVVILARPPTSASLKITDLFFCYALPYV